MRYRDDDIPEEEFATRSLDEQEPQHVDILQRQKVMRCGFQGFLFPEHFYWRYFDLKIKKQTYHFSEDDLRNKCIGTELYLSYLQMAGLIKVFSDTLQDDPYGRKGSVRLIQAALVRG